MEQKRGGGKKQEKKKAGAQASSPAHKAGIQRTFLRLKAKKLRRVLQHSGLAAAREYAEETGQIGLFRELEKTVPLRVDAFQRRQGVREAYASTKLAAAAARHEAARAAEVAAAAEAEKKAKRSAAAKKGVATRKARREAATPAAQAAV